MDRIVEGLLDMELTEVNLDRYQLKESSRRLCTLAEVMPHDTRRELAYLMGMNAVYPDSKEERAIIADIKEQLYHCGISVPENTVSPEEEEA